MDKRRDKRFPRRLTVRFGERDLLRSGYTHDISTSGVFVVTSQLIPLDTRVHLQVLMNAERFLYFEGIVRRHPVVPASMRQIEPGGFGVRFLMPSELVGEVVPKSGKGNHFEVVLDSKAHLLSALESEIKYGGIFISTVAPIPRDAAVTIEFRLDFINRALPFTGKVVQVISASAKGIAVMFDDKKNVEDTLKSFVR